MDNRSLSFGSDTIGTFTFSGHGGSSVMGQWDDVTPNAYEEVWDTTSGADVRIDGRSGNNLLAYTSPDMNGVVFKAAHQQAAETTTATDNNYDLGSYTDFGVQIAPEMIEGLSLGYAMAEVDESATVTNDESTLWVTYTTGPISVGYQTSSVDGLLIVIAP